MEREGSTGAPVLERSTTMNEEETANEGELTAVIWEEDEVFMFLCPELGVTSCGDTLEDAAAMLQEAVVLFFEDAELLDATLIA